MRPLRRVLAVAVFALASFVITPAAQTTTGTLVITENTTLTEDHYGGMVIGADNITLDGGGFTVYGSGDIATAGAGIDISWRSGVTVQNVRVTGFTQGIEAIGSFNATVKDAYVFANPGNGFHVGLTAASSFIGNTVKDNGAHGFDIWNSIGVTLTENVVTGNLDGIRLSGGSQDITLQGNRVTSNDAFGIVLSQASDNLLTGNTANSNAVAGIVLSQSDSNTLQANTTNSNEVGVGIVDSSDWNDVNFNVANENRYGFYVRSAANNTISGNRASGNRDFGYALFSANGNYVTGNLASENRVVGFTLFEGSTGNRFTWNRADRNRVEGFNIDDSDANVFTDNTSNQNLRGFWVGNTSSGNFLGRNTAVQNRKFDAVDDLTGSANVWMENSFEKTSGI